MKNNTKIEVRSILRLALVIASLILVAMSIAACNWNLFDNSCNDTECNRKGTLYPTTYFYCVDNGSECCECQESVYLCYSGGVSFQYDRTRYSSGGDCVPVSGPNQSGSECQP